MKITTQERVAVSRVAKLILARESFWDYCKVVDGGFYKDRRPHLYRICNTLNNFYFGLPLESSGKIYQNLMLNIPPQHGKTRTLVHFTNWVLGRNSMEAIITGSYNDRTAWDFSKYARDEIIRKKVDPADVVFSDVFPRAKLKKGTAEYSKWALEGRHFNYMGVGVGGSVTSKGASIMICDDLIKGAVEAFNVNYLDNIWLWYTSTFLSRISAEAERLLRIMCMTRWAKADPCGRLLDMMPDEWFVLKMEAYDKETDTMLCTDFLEREKYEFNKKIMAEEIFLANYHQEPIDIRGRLYAGFKTYTKLPEDDYGRLIQDRRRVYVDTADQGDDYLCAIFVVDYGSVSYVIDVYYTKDSAEITEKETASRINNHKINVGDIESNAGGRAFARNIRRILKEQYGNQAVVRWFHQSQPKSRILSNSASVQEYILMPAGWKERWPEFARDTMNYLKEGKNQHDDAPDALTGIIERKRKRMEFA